MSITEERLIRIILKHNNSMNFFDVMLKYEQTFSGYGDSAASLGCLENKGIVQEKNERLYVTPVVVAQWKAAGKL